MSSKEPSEGKDNYGQEIFMSLGYPPKIAGLQLQRSNLDKHPSSSSSSC